MKEEKNNLELVISDGKNINLEDDLILSVNNDEDTMDLTEITKVVKEQEGDKVE